MSSKTLAAIQAASTLTTTILELMIQKQRVERILQQAALENRDLTQEEWNSLELAQVEARQKALDSIK